jgi:uncharacterized Zn finger protein
MPFWDEPDFEKSGPIRVDNGIRARSKRGAIGSSWWSRRFIDVLEGLDLGTRLANGRAYARSGQVLNLEVAAGSVTATVQGSRPRPYEVSVALKQIWPTQWERIERALADQVIFSAKLLAGELPPDLERVFAELKQPLFPGSAGELTMECNCPDWSVPCKHVAATLYLLAEAFDQDPFLILTWRGRNKAELLTNLRRLRTPESSTVDSAGPRTSVWDELRAAPQPALADRVDRYFACQGRTTRLETRPEIIVPDAVLRERDLLPVAIRDTPLVDLLRPAYLAMGPNPHESPL